MMGKWRFVGWEVRGSRQVLQAVASLAVQRQYPLVELEDGWAVRHADERDAGLHARLQALPLQGQVKGAGGLVHYRKLGPVEEQPRKAEALLLPPGEHVVPHHDGVE
eukprot:EG_transcript_37569